MAKEGVGDGLLSGVLEGEASVIESGKSLSFHLSPSVMTRKKQPAIESSSLNLFEKRSAQIDRMERALQGPDSLDPKELNLVFIEAAGGAPPDQDAIERCLKLGANPNLILEGGAVSGDPILKRAVLSGSLRFVTALLEAGASVEQRDHGNASVIYHAIQSGSDEMVKALWLAGSSLGRAPGAAGALSIYAQLAGKPELAAWLDALWESGEIESAGVAPGSARTRAASRPRL